VYWWNTPPNSVEISYIDGIVRNYILPIWSYTLDRDWIYRWFGKNKSLNEQNIFHIIHNVYCGVRWYCAEITYM